MVQVCWNKASEIIVAIIYFLRVKSGLLVSMMLTVHLLQMWGPLRNLLLDYTVNLTHIFRLQVFALCVSTSVSQKIKRDKRNSNKEVNRRYVESK